MLYSPLSLRVDLWFSFTFILHISEWSYHICTLYFYRDVLRWTRQSEVIYIPLLHVNQSWCYYILNTLCTYFPLLSCVILIIFVYLSDIFLPFFFIEKRINNFFRFFPQNICNISVMNYNNYIYLIILKLNFCLFRKRLKRYRLFKRN